MRLRPWIMWRRCRERELDEEIQAHLAMAKRDRMERGESPEESECNARREFGNVTLVKEVTRETWGWSRLDRLAQDLRYVLRTLRKSPGFTLAAAFVLALTIGPVVAIFAFVDAILLRPLPYRDSDRLVMVWETRKGAPPRSSASAPWIDPRQTPVSAPNFLDWTRGQRVFDAMEPIAFGWFGIETEQVLGGRAGAGFFDMLGTSALLGRTFGPAARAHHQAAGRAVALLPRREFGRHP